LADDAAAAANGGRRGDSSRVVSLRKEEAETIGF